MEATDFFARFGIEHAQAGEHHHARFGWIQLKSCPFCNSDNYHLGFNLTGRYFVCWRCGGLKTLAVLQALQVDRNGIREFFQDLELPEFVSRPQGRLVEPKHRGPLLKAHRRYLKERGYDPDELVRIWELEGIGLSDRLSWRLYIPLIVKGKRVSWTTRTIGSKGQRYVSAAAEQEAIPHKHCIYGSDLARHSLVVVEGPADAWRIGPGAGALFGTAFTAPQVRKITQYPYRFILFDNEPHAQEQAQKLADQLSCFPGETSILETDCADPGEMSPREVRRLRRLTKLAEFR